MSFEEKYVFEITTVDKQGTSTREDGFAFDTGTKRLTIASYIPDPSLVEIEAVELAIKNNWVIRPRDKPFFRKIIGIPDGFSFAMPTRCILAHFDYPYNKPIVTVGKAVILTAYSFEEAKIHGRSDLRLKGLGHFFSILRYPQLSPHAQVHELMLLLNGTCDKFLRKSGLPFLGKNKSGKIVVRGGHSTISRPLRDVASLINCWQLSNYLDTPEKRAVWFSHQDLQNFLKK